MPKFACSCGHVINLSDATSEDELSLVPETNIMEIAEQLSKDPKLTDEQFFSLIDKSKQAVYRCPVCKRLHVEIGINRFDSYVLESAERK